MTASRKRAGAQPTRPAARAQLLPLASLLILLALWCSVRVVVADSANASDHNSGEQLRFGVVPQQSATKLAMGWVPFLHAVEEKSGVQLLFSTAKDIPAFEQRCAAGEYDVAYMNPLTYVVVHKNPGYIVFAKEKLQALVGIIVVRADSPYQRVEDLRGKVVAFPAPEAFAASILPRAHLHKLGIELTAHYQSSHDSVYRCVAKELVAAGGGIPRTLQTLEPDIRQQLRVLWQSQGYSPHAIAAHPRVAAATVQKIQQAMLDIASDPEGRGLLKNLAMKGLVAARDEEWDDVRRLHLESFLAQPPEK